EHNVDRRFGHRINVPIVGEQIPPRRDDMEADRYRYEQVAVLTEDSRLVQIDERGFEHRLTLPPDSSARWRLLSCAARSPSASIPPPCPAMPGARPGRRSSWPSHGREGCSTPSPRSSPA